MAENTHYSQNAYSRSHFPDDWDDEDFEFLASFLNQEFGARFQAVIDPNRDYEYELFVRGESDDDLSTGGGFDLDTPVPSGATGGPVSTINRSRGGEPDDV